MLAMSSICLYSPTNRTPTISAGSDWFSFCVCVFFFGGVKLVKTSQHVMGNVKGPGSYWPALLGSHWSSRTMEGSFFAPSTNSSRDSLPEGHKNSYRWVLYIFFYILYVQQQIRAELIRKQIFEWKVWFGFFLCDVWRHLVARMENAPRLWD